MNNENFGLIYKFEIESKKKGYDISEVIQRKEENESIGACDALILVSIVKGQKNPYVDSHSILIMSVDGYSDADKYNPDPIADAEMFPVMFQLGHQLLKGDSLPWQKKCIEKFLKSVRIQIGLSE